MAPLTGLLALAAIASGQSTGPPEARFTVSPAEPRTGQEVTFDASASSDPDGDPLRYAWDLDGDQTFETDTGTDPVARRAYESAGRRTVTLRVTEAVGRAPRSDFAQQTFTVVDPPPEEPPPPPERPLPTVDLTVPPSPPATIPTVLVAQGTGEGLRYAWDLDGDGTFERDTGEAPEVDHLFLTGGRHLVRVRATDALGRSAERSVTVDAVPPPALGRSKLTGNPKLGKAGTLGVTTGGDGPKAEWYEWRFASGRSPRSGGGTGAIGGYQLGATKATKAPQVKHVFTHEKTGFTMVAHGADGQTTTLFGTVHVDSDGKPGLTGGPGTAKWDYVTAFKVTADPVAKLYVGFGDASTDPKVAGASHTHVGWFLDQGNCLGGGNACKTISQLVAVFNKPGAQDISMTIKRKLPGKAAFNETAKRTISVGDVLCDLFKVRGVPVHGGVYYSGGPKYHCVAKTTDPASGKTAYKKDRFVVGGLDVTAKQVLVVPETGFVGAPPGGGKVEVAHRIPLGGGPQKPIVLTRRSAFTIPSGAGTMEAGFADAVAAERPDIRGLKAEGAIVRFNADAGADTTFHLRLPPPFDATADLTHRPSGAKAAAGNDLVIPGFSASFGPLSFTVDELVRDDAGWHGGGALDVLGIAVDATWAPDATPLATGFRFTSGGAFEYAGARYAGPGIPLGNSGVVLESLGAGINASPFTFLGSARFSAAKIFAATGCVALVIPQAGDVGKTAAFCTDEKGAAATHAIKGTGIAVRISGTMDLFDFLHVPGGAYAEFIAPSHIAFKAGVDQDFIPGDIDIGVRAFFNAQFENPHVWQVEAGTEAYQNLVCEAGFCPELEGSARVSSKGISACGTVFGLPVSGYRQHSGGFGFFIGTCDTAKAAVAAVASASPVELLRGRVPFVATAAQAGTRVTLRRGAPYALLAVEGADGPPRVTVSGPGGFSLVDDGRAGQRHGEHHGILRSDRLKTTYVYVPRPRAGSYAIGVQDGSTPIVRVQRAYGLARPTVLARVRRVAGRRVLAYRVTPVPGQRVTFVEEGAQASGVVGVARGRAGRLRLRPADGPGGARRIVALVEQDGLPRDRVTVARYRAPRPRALPRPVVSVRRGGGGLRVGWTRVPGAARYAVTVATSDGRVLRRTLSSRSLRVEPVPSTAGATVTVRALDRVLRTGRPGRERLRARRVRGAPRLS